MFFLLLFTIVTFVLTSCERDQDAVLVITERRFELKNYEEGVFYFTVQNQGEQPAFNVIVMAEAFKNDETIGYEEKGVGNLFEDESHSDTLHFHNFGYVNPDTVRVMMTYTPYNAINQ